MARSDWIVRKREAVGTGGAAATKHPLATAAAVSMLTRGGNAVDGAVAAAFCLGVVEPWMSGLGGGGFAVIHLAGAGNAVVVDFGMRAPLAATPDMYPLEAGRVTEELFPWRRVRADANIHGPLSIAVPGMVSGLALALTRFGRLDLETVLQPAIRAAEEGIPVDWFSTLQIAADARTLRRYGEVARIFLPDGLPPAPSPGLSVPLVVQDDLAGTLRLIAKEGPEVCTRGEIAERIVRAVRGDGGLLSLEDLATYTPNLIPGLVVRYRDWDVVTVPCASGGPAVTAVLEHLSSLPVGRLGHNTVENLDALARAAADVFAERDAGFSDLAPSRGVGDAAGPHGESTTHLSVADAAGNLVSLTQTLVSRFGSRYVVPGTGVLLNNGMFWFDPEPGRANSIAGGKRPQTNMAPLIVRRGGKMLAMGSSGGRRIICCNAQLVLNVVDHGFGLQAALEAPRVDRSSPQLLADDRIEEATLQELRRRGHDVVRVAESFLPRQFGSPAAAGMDAERGVFLAAADPYHVADARGINGTRP